jgi:hypothetical protein
MSRPTDGFPVDDLTNDDSSRSDHANEQCVTVGDRIAGRQGGYDPEVAREIEQEKGQDKK